VQINNHIIADILGDNVKVEYPVSGGARVSKNLSLDSFCTIMSNNVTKKNATKIYPIGLRVKAENENNIIVGYEIMEHVGEMKFQNDEPRGRGPGSVLAFNSVWPNAMTFVEFRKGANGFSLYKFYQFALKSPITSLSDTLFVWPGSNVFSGHDVCIGNIRVDSIQTIEESASMPFLFYNGVSNNDLTGDKFTPFKPEGSSDTINHPHVLYRYLEVKDGQEPKKFPYDILKISQTVSTFLRNHGY